MHLPGKITYKEIDEMIDIVDKNKDGKISYSEFRVSFTCLKISFYELNISGDVGSHSTCYLRV